MMRYRAFRDMLLNDWIYKKVFATMAELRGFYRDPKKSDPESALPETRDPQMEKRTMFLRDRLMQIKAMKDPDEQAYEYCRLKPMIDAHNTMSHRRYITMGKTAAQQRSKVKKKKHLLYPQIQFEKRLDVRQDENILNLWLQMAQMGWVSPRTVVSGAGLDYDSEMATIGSDAPQIMRNQLLMQSMGGGEGGGGGGGAPMGGIGIGPEAGGGLGPEGGEGVPPGGAGGDTGPGSKANVRSQQRKITAASLPPDIRGEIEALVKDDGNVEIFVKG
jgi:hypothetical protein